MGYLRMKTRRLVISQSVEFQRRLCRIASRQSRDARSGRFNHDGCSADAHGLVGGAQVRQAVFQLFGRAAIAAMDVHVHCLLEQVPGLWQLSGRR